MLKTSANWKYNTRVSSHIQDMSLHRPHQPITAGYPKVTDSRFETNMGSTFLGGEIMETSPVVANLRSRIHS